MRITGDVLETIGMTTLVKLRRIVPDGWAQVLLKMEAENPTGSMKDRMALAMIEAAEEDGRLAPGGSVVEYTGGSTGVSLSLVRAVRGHPLEIVTVSTADAAAMARRLAREEGLFAGTSTGANVVAALAVAEKLGPGATVVSVMVDSGIKYLSNPLPAA